MHAWAASPCVRGVVPVVLFHILPHELGLLAHFPPPLELELVIRCVWRVFENDLQRTPRHAFREAPWRLSVRRSGEISCRRRRLSVRLAWCAYLFSASPSLSQTASSQQPTAVAGDRQASVKPKRCVDRRCAHARLVSTHRHRRTTGSESDAPCSPPALRCPRLPRPAHSHRRTASRAVSW